ncbi:hypothetical protein V6N13_093404 [Hibiscus sabdariffa]
MSHKTDLYTKGKYRIRFGLRNEFTICYNDSKPVSSSHWQSVDPVMTTLPVFLLQLSVLIATSRVFMIFLRPLRQPRFLSELLAAVLLGPAALGSTGWMADNVTPFEGSLFLETMANLGVTFYMFLVGLEMDLSPVRKMGRTALSFAIAGIILPLAAGAGLHSIVQEQKKSNRAPEMGAYFWSIALSLTSFSDLARILSDLKLMHTDLVIFLAISAKIVGALLVCLYFKCPMRDGLALGVLMNTKGVLAVIILNEGRNMKGFDQQTYSWIVVAIVLMTVIIGPVVSYTHKSARHLKSYNDRHLERSKPDTPLRVLACVHSTKNLSGLISLLQISNATRKSPITVFAVHLVELAGRTSAMLIFHDKNKTIDTGNNCSREKAEAEQIKSKTSDPSKEIFGGETFGESQKMG